MTCPPQYAAASDIGRVRQDNEDAFCAVLHGGTALCGGSARDLCGPCNEDAASSRVDDSPALFAAVCDGMGGVEGGEVASRLALDELLSRFSQLSSAAAVLPCAETLREATLAADRRVRAAADADPFRKGMGTTLSALWIAGGRCAIAQVGDSRAYLWREGSLTQLTEDQTVLRSLEREGRVPVNPAVIAQFRSTLEQVVGGEGDLVPETLVCDVCEGDLFILCSDGFYDGLPSDALSVMLHRHAGHEDLDRLTRRLVKASVCRSGRDNTTAVLAGLGRIRPRSSALLHRVLR